MTDDPSLLPLSAVEAAAVRIAPHVAVTPIVAMTPTGLRLKAENLHPIGAFKMRGAFNALLSLGEVERAKGVVAHSSGNHAQAVAYAAHTLGMSCAIVMPESAPKLKIEATRRWGADIHIVPFDATSRATKTAELAAQHGYSVIEPYDAMPIMAGTGTIAREILSQCANVETIFVPVSGGGLAGGVSAAVAHLNPSVRVIGVEPEFAADAQQSFRKGEIVAIAPSDAIRTIADGLRVTQLGERPWANIRRYVHDIITVREADIRAAMRRIMREARLVAEPSGAVAIAGALAHGTDPAKAVAVLSGGNVEAALYAGIIGEDE